MKIFILATLFVCSQLASAFTVFRPDGIVNVQPTGHGFNVIDLTKNEITSVTKTSEGYVIFPQEGEPTFIHMSPGDEDIQRDIIIPSAVDDDLL